MAKINGAFQVAAASIIRSLLNTATSGSAVITKVIAGLNVSLSSTGADVGTGDVTVNATCAGALFQIGANTLTSQTAAQAAFSGGGATNGLALAVGIYEMDAVISLSAMSSTSGSFGFALGGTAVVAAYMDISAIKSNPLATGATPQQTWTFATANTAVAAANTSTTGEMRIKGLLRVTTAGSIIPQVSLGIAAAASVASGCFFIVKQLTTNTSQTSVGTTA